MEQACHARTLARGQRAHVSFGADDTIMIRQVSRRHAPIPCACAAPFARTLFRHIIAASPNPSTTWAARMILREDASASKLNRPQPAALCTQLNALPSGRREQSCQALHFLLLGCSFPSTGGGGLLRAIGPPTHHTQSQQRSPLRRCSTCRTPTMQACLLVSFPAFNAFAMGGRQQTRKVTSHARGKVPSARKRADAPRQHWPTSSPASGPFAALLAVDGSPMHTLHACVSYTWMVAPQRTHQPTRCALHPCFTGLCAPLDCFLIHPCLLRSSLAADTVCPGCSSHRARGLLRLPPLTGALPHLWQRLWDGLRTSGPKGCNVCPCSHAFVCSTFFSGEK
jgi:hypothetical protein